MATCFQEGAGAHVRAADAEHDHAVDLARQSIGALLQPSEKACLPFPGMFVEQPLGQVVEARIERLFRGRDVAAASPQIGIGEHFRSCLFEPRPQFIEVAAADAAAIEKDATWVVAN
jgi:hypothetical protein